MFLKALKDHDVISGIASAFGGSLVKRMNDRDGLTPADKEFVNRAKLKNLSLSRFEGFIAKPDIVDRIFAELTHVNVPREHLALVQDAYEKYFERPYDPQPGDDYYLFHRQGVTEPRGPNPTLKK